MTNEQLSYTIGEMYRIADDFRYDVSPYSLHSESAIFDFVKSIPYRRDVDFCGSPECLQRPKYTIGGGDCDDKAIFAGAAFNLLGIPWRFVTVAYNPDEVMEHVYLEIFYSGFWLPFDATYRVNSIFIEKPYTKKIVWDNPMMQTKSYGVKTLEGSPIDRPLGFAPLVILADIDALLESLKSLPLIGSLFKGKTQHLPYDTAISKSQEIGNQAVKIFQGLPDDTAKAYALQLSKSFFDNWVMPDLGHRWDNAIANDYQRVISGNYPNLSDYWKQSDAFKFQYYMAQPLFYFLFEEDVTRIEDSIRVWFTDPVKARVWDPLDSYLAQNYGTTTAGGTSSPSTPAAAGGAGMLGLLAIGGAILAAMSKKGR